MIEMRIVTLKPWQIWLGAGLSVAVALAVLFLAASLALILIPAVLIGGAVMAVLARFGILKARRAPDDGIISVDYVVTDAKDRVFPRQPGEDR